MSPELKKFARRSALFVLPFLLLGMITVIVDPYNYFALPSPVDDGLKESISFKMNYAMWKMLAYRRDPAPNILLGDSRMMSMDSEKIEELSGVEYANLAYGGGSLQEALETARFASRQGVVQNIYLGLDLNNYNASDTKDRVTEVLAAIKNPFLYLTNNNTVLATMKLLQSEAFDRPASIGKPREDKEAFWEKQLEVTARVYYANYRDPVEYRKRLEGLSLECREQGINLVFIIFPSHMDLQAKIDHYGLLEADLQFRSDLAEWGLVYDFAWDNEITRDRNLFKDPYHFDEEIEESIVRSIWGQEPSMVHVYGTPTVTRGALEVSRQPSTP